MLTNRRAIHYASPAGGVDMAGAPQRSGQWAQWNRREFVSRWRDVEPSNAPVSETLFAALKLQPGEHVLDIGCGGGQTTLDAAERVGASGAATGFDISEPMLEIARERARAHALGNVTFAAGDAQVESPPNGPFDAVMSRFGVMFFADPVAAFTNIRRQMRPDGRIAFASWQALNKNEWFPGAVLAKYRHGPPPDPGAPPQPGPFALAGEDYTRSILAAAGFTDISFHAHGYEWREPAKAVDGLLLEAMDLDTETKARAMADLEAHAASMTVDGVIRQERNYWIVTAANG
jgi:SAM-dependent methyltransferase